MVHIKKHDKIYSTCLGGVYTVEGFKVGNLLTDCLEEAQERGFNVLVKLQGIDIYLSWVLVWHGDIPHNKMDNNEQYQSNIPN